MNKHYISIDKCISKAKQKMFITLSIGIVGIILTYFLLCQTKDSFFTSLIFIEIIGTIVFTFICYLKIYYVKKIKNYMLKNKLDVECNQVIYWSKNNYLLTANYFCLVFKRKVHVFLYSDIQSIKIEEYYEMDSGVLLFNLRRFLHIRTKNGQLFRIEMCDSYSKNDDEIIEDISPILLDKNKNIIVESPIKKPWYK